MTARSRRSLVALFALGLTIRALEMPLRGTSDVYTQKLWSYGASENLAGVYGVGGHPPARFLIQWGDISGYVDYPPLALEELAAVGRAYRLVDPGYADGVVLTVFVKLTGLAFEIGFVALLLTWGVRLMGETAAVWAAVAFWLNPAVWFTGSGLGYVDAQGAVPVAIGFLAALAGSPVLAGISVAIAVCTKPQCVFLVPVIAALLVRASGRPLRALVNAAACGTLSTLVICAPFLWRGTWPNMLNGVSRLLHHDMLSGQGSNLGWILTWILRVRYAVHDLGWYKAIQLTNRILGIGRVVELGYPNFRVIGTTLVLTAIAWAVWRTSRGVSRPAAAALAGWCVYAYTILGAQVHENHFYPAIPFFVMAAAEVKPLRAVYWWSSAIFALNIYLFYGLGEGWPPLIARRWTFVDMTVLLAVINVGVFALSTRMISAIAAPQAESA